MVRKKRVIAAVSALAMAGLGLAACGGGGSEAPNGEFRYFITEPKSLIPPNTTESEGSTIEELVYAGLYDYHDDGTLDPVIAKSEPTTTDNIHWTIKLNSGWKFQNGEKITAKSVVDSVNYGAYGPNAAAGNGFYSKIAGYDAMQGKKPKAKTLTGAKAKDDTTVEFTLSKPFAGFSQLLGYTAYFPMAPACLKDIKGCNNKPIGSGPYKIDGKWDHNKQIKVKRWSGYKGEKASIKNFNFKIYSNAATNYADFEGNKLDMSTVPAEKFEEADKKYGSKIIQDKTPIVEYTFFPVYDKYFKDVNVRKAFALAIDRDKLNKGLNQGRYTPADAWTGPGIPGYKKNTCGDLCTYNKKKAKSLLAKSSWPKGKKVSIWTYTGDTSNAEAKAMGDQFKNTLGLDYEIKSIDWNQLQQKQQDHKVTGPLVAQLWSPDYALNEDYLFPQFGAEGNTSGYSNPDFLKKIDEGNTAKDLKSAEAKYTQAEEVLATDPPAVPLWSYTTATLLGDRVYKDSFHRNPALGSVSLKDLKLKKQYQ